MPLTNTDRLTYAKLAAEGRIFSVNVELNLPSNATESPIAILTNTAGSGKLLYLSRITVDILTKGRQTTFRVYAAPTITANGTAITIANNNIGGASLPPTVSTAFSSPTISSNGVKARTFSGGKDSNSLLIDVENSIVLSPGLTILLTGIPSDNNTVVAISASWAEL